MPGVERKLTTILAADVVEFSKLMGEDEAGTLEALKACRSIIDGVVEDHHGRVFGSAGDSVIVEFSSPVHAVWCASEFQKLIAQRNATLADKERMRFRVGINLGDVIIEGDNLYGDGVNVAARLESISQPGGICVSKKVYEEVKRRLDLRFVDGGERKLKNIEDPVAIYHVQGDSPQAPAADTAPGATPPAGAKSAAVRAAAGSEKPSISVLPMKTIGGDDEARVLAQGLTEDIVGGLAKQTAITVIARPSAQAVGGADEPRADFVLEGSVRAAGQRLRLSFTLVDTASGSEVWAERYDRTLDDVFDLEDEISESVVSTLRVRVKALALERLRDIDDEELSVPDLLNKAAGLLVESYGNNEEVAQILGAAIAKAPENSMAKAMMVFALHRRHEFAATAIPEEVKNEMIALAEEAMSLDPSSYFARLVAAVVDQDLLGDYRNALTQAETAVELNPNFTQAQAMVGIAQCHLGKIDEGLERLRRAIDANKQDPHRFRHHREVAIAHFLAERYDRAAELAARLVQQAPDLARNRLVLAALHWRAGESEAARRQVADLLREVPELRLATARPVMFADEEAGKRFREALSDAGLPD